MLYSAFCTASCYNASGGAAAMAAAGHFLRVQRYYTFCLVVAAIECINMPFGTVLGIFTIITLVDEKGKSMFNRTHVGLAENEEL